MNELYMWELSPRVLSGCILTSKCHHMYLSTQHYHFLFISDSEHTCTKYEPWINYRSVEVRSEIFQTKPKAINNDKYIQRTPPKSDPRVLLYNPKDLRTLRHTLLYDIWEQQSQHSLSSFNKGRNGTAFAVLVMICSTYTAVHRMMMKMEKNLDYAILWNQNWMNLYNCVTVRIAMTFTTLAIW